MNNYTFTDEDIKLIEKFIDIRNRGYYCDGKQLTEVYNRVLNKRVASTSCGSCIRQRITELEGALNQFKKQLETSKKQEEETKVSDETITKPIKVGRKTKK